MKICGDLQFEYRVGKLSDTDYQQTKITLQKELAVVLGEIERLSPKSGAVTSASVSPRSQAGTVCPHCGASFPNAHLSFAGNAGRRWHEGHWLIAFAALRYLGAVDGVVINGTTGKPQPSVMVTLVQPGQGGMQTIATVKSDAEGKFKIDKEYPPGPALLQAMNAGVIYNQILPPGSPTTGVTVKVYDSTNNPETGKSRRAHDSARAGGGWNPRQRDFLFTDNQSRMKLFGSGQRLELSFMCRRTRLGKSR